ncbi:MAG: Holliday junction branch migration protein RuvA [Ignavibacteriales bacterium]|nr:Holliday junction branch migration protein RuvA [Ignavibacteriales bacterium]
MISHLRGKLVQKSPTEITIDVNGVGYHVHIPLSTFEKIEKLNGDVVILTHMHVREDAMILFGFATEAERDIFRLLISVSGIGPKIAQGILSGIGTNDLREAILLGNIEALTSISGVGRKTAERIILELRSKLGKIEFTEQAVTPTSQQLKSRSEAIIALMSLGFNRTSAEQTLRAVLIESTNKELSVEEMIKKALHHSAKQR